MRTFTYGVLQAKRSTLPKVQSVLNHGCSSHEVTPASASQFALDMIDLAEDLATKKTDIIGPR